MNKLLAAASLALALLAGCANPNKFLMTSTVKYGVEGKIMGSNDDIVIDGNSAVVSPPSRIALRTVGCTDCTFSTQATMNDDTRADFHIRTTVYNDTAFNKQGIVLEVSMSDKPFATIRLDERVVRTVPLTIKPGVPFIIAAETIGRNTRIEVGCTDLGFVRTPMESAEWVVITPVKGSISLVDPYFLPVKARFMPSVPTYDYMMPASRMN